MAKSTDPSSCAPDVAEDVAGDFAGEFESGAEFVGDFTSPWEIFRNSALAFSEDFAELKFVGDFESDALSEWAEGQAFVPETLVPDLGDSTVTGVAECGDTLRDRLVGVGESLGGRGDRRLVGVGESLGGRGERRFGGGALGCNACG